MSPFRTRLLQLLTPGPSGPAKHVPARDDDIATWLKQQRDQMEDRFGRLPAWYVLDDLLDTYRLHADTVTPLDQHVPCACTPADCAGCDNRHPF